MPVYKHLSYIRLVRALPLAVVTLLLGSGVIAGTLQAASDERIDLATPSHLAIPDCNNRAHGTEKVVVERSDGTERTFEMCDSLGQGDISATARALSTAIDAEAGMSKFYADARMPELLSLRLSRARTDVNTTLEADVRIQELAAIDFKIDALEHAMAKTGTTR
jgi:hypothetical protein